MPTLPFLVLNRRVNYFYFSVRTTKFHCNSFEVWLRTRLGCCSCLGSHFPSLLFLGLDYRAEAKPFISPVPLPPPHPQSHSNMTQGTHTGACCCSLPEGERTPKAKPAIDKQFEVTD